MLNFLYVVIPTLQKVEIVLLKKMRFGYNLTEGETGD